MGSRQTQQIVSVPRVNPSPLVDTGSFTCRPPGLGKVSIYNLNVEEPASKMIHSTVHVGTGVGKRYVVISKEQSLSSAGNLVAIGEGKANQNKVYFVIRKV